MDFQSCVREKTRGCEFRSAQKRLLRNKRKKKVYTKAVRIECSVDWREFTLLADSAQPCIGAAGASGTEMLMAVNLTVTCINWSNIESIGLISNTSRRQPLCTCICTLTINRCNTKPL